MKRLLCLLLALIMLIGAFNTMPVSIFAHAEDVKKADPSTLDDWKHLFGEEVTHTGNAGAVWADKSVLADGSTLGVTLDDSDNFAVALSAIASHMSVVGYTGVPTDTMLVVDMDVPTEKIDSAAKQLLAANNYNRVGALICSGETAALIPVDRYSSDKAFTSENSENAGYINGIQSAVYTAMKELVSTRDTVIDDGIQSGTKRMPVVIVMSDREIEAASSAYTQPEDVDIVGTTQSIFATQLTVGYAAAQIEKHYDRSALIYTLGTDNAVLDSSSSDEVLNSLWSSFDSCSAGTSMQLKTASGYRSIAKTADALSLDYVNAFYGSGAAAIDKAIAAVIKNSLYYPTYVEGDNSDLGGYIEFVDDIGRYMEVKDIKGIRLGDLLFTGEALCRNFQPDGGSLGTVSSPNELGNQMIWAVMERLGIDSLSTAQQIVNLAYRSGQLSYDPETGEFSNYIGWYADEDGSFLGHGTDSHLSVPDEAVFYNKSYGFLGRASDGYDSSDLMYASVQVHTRISTGTQAVIFRIPAALIPVINYNISFSGESLEDPGAITLEYDNRVSIDTTGDNNIDSEVEVQPIRLIYEVGLKDEINDITVHDIVSEDYEHIDDGVYTFYTNRWDQNDLTRQKPSQAKNTVAYFTPSAENERYYYTEDTDIYMLSKGEYVRYNGASKPVYEEGKYFRAHKVFEYSDSANGGNAVIHTLYEEMTEHTLSCARKGRDGWYIPKGTVYRFFNDHAHTKSENVTDTIEYSHLINVEKIDGTASDDLEYYVDFILGNNGMMTLKAAQGIELTSVPDDTMRGRMDSHEFEITGPDGIYRFVKYYSADRKTEKVLEIKDGKAAFTAMPGEKVYIVDLPAGAYNITEITDGKDYTVKSVNGVESHTIGVTVPENGIAKVEFTNTLKAPTDSATLILYNKIDHPLGDGADTLYHQFVYDVSFDGHTETVYLYDEQDRIFSDIPIGSTVTITEKDLPAGFTCDRDGETVTVDITEAGVYVVDYVNTYTPLALSGADITMKGEVKLIGRELSAGDEFSFKLQKFDGSDWVDMAGATATGAQPTFDFTKYMQAEQFDSVGVYTYRVAPVIDENPYRGITYDKMTRWFEVAVSDNDWNGRYEIYSILGFSGAIVAKNGNRWELYTDFESKYSVGGSDTVTVRVHTQVDGNADADLSGYVYGLYQNGELVQTLPRSSHEGECELTLSFGASEIGNTIEYTVKPIARDNTAIAYSDKVYTVSVKITDDLEGGVNVTATVDAVSSKEAELTFIHTYLAPVTDKETDTTVSDPPVNTDKPADTSKKPSTSPLTADMGVILWIVIMTASIFCLTVLYMNKKKGSSR